MYTQYIGLYSLNVYGLIEVCEMTLTIIKTANRTGMQENIKNRKKETAILLETRNELGLALYNNSIKHSVSDDIKKELDKLQMMVEGDYGDREERKNMIDGLYSKVRKFREAA